MIKIDVAINPSDPSPTARVEEPEKRAAGRHAPMTEAERQLALGRRIARDNQEALAALAR